MLRVGVRPVNLITHKRSSNTFVWGEISQNRISRYMEKQDVFVGPANRKTEIPEALKATLARCRSIPQQLNSLTAEKLGSCKKEEPTVAAIGTGVYFQNLSLIPVDCSDMNELQDLFTLATVACEVESSIRRRQLVKKRRTPRNVSWINRIPRIQNDNCRRGLPASGGNTVKRQRIGSLTGLCAPSWIKKSIPPPDSSRNISHSSNKVILKIGSQQHSIAGKMANKSSRVKFSKVSKGNRVPSVLSMSRPRRPPGKDTRVQGVAKKILQFVGDGSSAEKFIRGALGNNPDTSKALRLLLAQRKVYRVGDGGRGKAFMYVATPAGLQEIEQSKGRGSSEDDAVIDHRPGHYQDGQVTLKDKVSASTNAQDVLLAPYCPPGDVKTCFPTAVSPPKAALLRVLQAVLGKNMDTAND